MMQPAMPELPELEALRIRLGPRLQGRLVTAVRVNPKKGFMLRYPVEAFEHEVPIRRFAATWRRGKHLGFDLELAGGGDCRSLVINPMLGGRFQVESSELQPPAAFVFALRLEGAEELRYLDFRDMGRIYWVRDRDEVPGWNEMGPEADGLDDLGLEDFRRRLRRYRESLKDVLRNQALLAGIGNAYSDEILWEAGILPLRRRSTLKPVEEDKLFNAVPAVLRRATEAILANPNYDESKQDRSFMAVHARGGKNCPRCGHRISQLGSNREPVNFCRGCQH
jgi:formamidopyrimidine-DNA glycosylase